MDDGGVVVVVIVSTKEGKQKLFFLGVSNYRESSLSLPSILPLWLVLLYNPDDNISFATSEPSEALLRWVCI